MKTFNEAPLNALWESDQPFSDVCDFIQRLSWLTLTWAEEEEEGEGRMKVF